MPQQVFSAEALVNRLTSPNKCTTKLGKVFLKKEAGRDVERQLEAAETGE